MTERRWGTNGDPEIVPQSRYAACSVFDQHGQNVFTDIYPFSDDPLFEFRDESNSPHLSQGQRDVINLPHRKMFWRKEGRTRAHDPSAERARDEAEALLCREHIYIRRHVLPAELFESKVGGWLPQASLVIGLSQSARDLAERHAAKAARDYATADIIRRVVNGGQVEVADFADGTMWFFP